MKLTKRAKTVALIFYILAALYLLYTIFTIVQVSMYLASIESSGMYVQVGLVDKISYFLTQVGPALFYTCTIFGIGYTISMLDQKESSSVSEVFPRPESITQSQEPIHVDEYEDEPDTIEETNEFVPNPPVTFDEIDVLDLGNEDVAENVFQAPIEGRVASITETPDEAFSQKMLGDGIVIFPTGDTIVAPCDGVVEVLFPTNHAIALKSDDGTDVLIHVGVDTVNLEGRGFKNKVEVGDRVSRGQELLEIDLDYINDHAPSSAIPVVFTELTADQEVNILKTGDVEQGEEVIEIVNK